MANVSLAARQGEFIALLGPSGCGKTTLLRCIAGFISPDTGQISIDGIDLTQLPPYERPLNTVFQNYALFPHMTVRANLEYGPRRRRLSKTDIAGAVADVLRLVGLDGFDGRLPRELSGGQQQRVALARAIVNKPRLLLLDEPLGALDLKLRKQMQIELKRLQTLLGITFIFVTHDQEEAMTMADRIVVMNRGRIEQIGTPAEIYTRPRSLFVAEFIGEANILNLNAKGANSWQAVCGGPVIARATASDPNAYVGMIRPEDIVFRNPDDPAALPAKVTDIIDIGGQLLLQLDVAGSSITMRQLGATRGMVKIGDDVHIGWSPGSMQVIEAHAT